MGDGPKLVTDKRVLAEMFASEPLACPVIGCDGKLKNGELGRFTKICTGPEPHTFTKESLFYLEPKLI